LTTPIGPPQKMLVLKKPDTNANDLIGWGKPTAKASRHDHPHDGHFREIKGFPARRLTTRRLDPDLIHFDP
jgi:hypothetical protein